LQHKKHEFIVPSLNQIYSVCKVDLNKLQTLNPGILKNIDELVKDGIKTIPESDYCK
jgi:hypothetical protein